MARAFLEAWFAIWRDDTGQRRTPAEVFARVEPVIRTLVPENGYGLTGPSNSGHFIKMVHNGIEYGMMQAYRGVRNPRKVGALAWTSAG